jgi:hypothetical protein
VLFQKKEKGKRIIEKSKMKKIVRTMCLVAMVALVATSCKKNEQSTSFNVDFGEVKGFEAAPSLDGTKAYIDVFNGGIFKWNDNDQIMVYNLSSDYTDSKCAVYNAAPNSEGQHSTTFSGDPIDSKKDLGYFLFYHPTKAHKEIEAGNRETFTVARTQNYDEQYMIDPTSLVMACPVGEANGHVGSSFTLQHIFGILNVGIGDVWGNKVVDSIQVQDMKWQLWGNLSLKLPQVSASKFDRLFTLCEASNGYGATYLTELDQYLKLLGYEADGKGKQITLNCCNLEGTGIALPYLQWKYFFISLRPGALNRGFILRVYLHDSVTSETTTIIKEFNESANYLIKPGYFRNIYLDTAGNLY